MTKKEKVIEYIKNLIKTNDFDPDKRIQSEADLAKELSVSVLTVRNAFSELERDNIIERRHGSGTYLKSFKRYVVIILDEQFFYDPLLVGIRNFVISSGLYKLFSDTQWIPVFYEDIKDKCPVNINEIACIINLYQWNCKLIDIAREKHIPIVEFGNELSPYAKVSINEILRHRQLIKILEENKFEKVIVFDFVNEFNNYGSTIDKFYSNYMKENYYYFFQNIIREKKESNKVLTKGFESITEPPDAIVFMNYNLFVSAKYYLKKYNEYIKDSKFIIYNH